MIMSFIILLVLSFTYTLAAQPQLNCSKYLLNAGQSRNENIRTKENRFDDFDWDLSKELNAIERGNIVVSPISLKVVLAMLFEGAKGKTAQEIGEALNLQYSSEQQQKQNKKRSITRERFSTILNSLQTSKGQYEIKIGTHVFIDKSALPKEPYICKLQNYYNSSIEKVDFHDKDSVVKVINNWASNVTEGHIQDLISDAEDHSSTIMMLLNAVYFKGKWEIPFPDNETKLASFYLDEIKTVQVPMMRTMGSFGYYNIIEYDAKLIRLPYMGGKFAMFVVLPNRKSGLAVLANALGPERSLAPYLANMTETKVNLIMPKFEYDFTISLRPVLEQLGIGTMFTVRAELSDIADTNRGKLVVSNVLQKAGISVTEVGTIAYAATQVELMDKFGGEDDAVEFKVDHPFLFFIEDLTVNTTVFVGKVTNPDKAKVHNLSSTYDATSITPDEPTNIKLPEPETDKIQTPTETSPCDGGLTFGANEEVGTYEQAIQKRFNFFDADLLNEIAKSESGNFVISPASIKALLALVLEGADGSTLSELKRVLRQPEDSSQARQLLSTLHASLQSFGNSKVIVDSTSQIFISKALTPNVTYEKLIKDCYKADVSLQDFSVPDVATNNINSWISTRTRGLIPTLVGPGVLTKETYAFLASTIFFEGKWKTEFDPTKTKEMCFYPEPNYECQKTKGIYKDDHVDYRFDVSLDSHILQLPYQDERLCMVLIVPHRMDGIKRLTMEAPRMSFPALVSKMRRKEVHLRIPSFTIEYGGDLTETLKKLGMEKVFSDNANLPYMIKNKAVKLSAIVHKAKIEVTEKGTKAAAAAGAVVVPLMYGQDLDLEVNHPFYYFLYDKERQSVLFAGRYSSVEGVPHENTLDGLQPLNGGTKPNTQSVRNQNYAPENKSH